MKKSLILVSVLALGLVLVLTIGSSLAQEPAGRARPAGDLAIEAVVNSKFTYQGMLLDSGVPVDSPQDMIFRLYSDSGCATQVGSDIARPGVAVNDGIFGVELDVDAGDVNGKGLWLEVEVGGMVVGCQEILPVPYALSLRPGARVIGEVMGWDGLHVKNTATTGFSWGIYGQSDSIDGIGVAGRAEATSGPTYGVSGSSNSPDGAGVVARGAGDSTDLLLSGSSSLSDNGTLRTDPLLPSSDLILHSNDKAWIFLDSNDDEADETFRLHNGEEEVLLQVDESGAVQSAAASYLWLSGNDVRPYHQSDSTVIDMDSFGGAKIQRGATAGSKTVMLPITVPGVWYGQDVTVSGLDIYWVGTNEFQGITAIRLRRQTGVCDPAAPAACYAEILADTTAHSCSSVAFPTGCVISHPLTTNNVLTADSGVLYLTLTLSFTDDTAWIDLGGVRLTLEHN